MNKIITLILTIAIAAPALAWGHHGGGRVYCHGGYRDIGAHHGYGWHGYHHHYYHGGWGRGGCNFWPGFAGAAVGAVVGGVIANTVTTPTTVVAPAPVVVQQPTVVTTPTVVQTTPVVTTTPVVQQQTTYVNTTYQTAPRWVPGQYVDFGNTRVWQPGHYE